MKKYTAVLAAALLLIAVPLVVDAHGHRDGNHRGRWQHRGPSESGRVQQLPPVVSPVPSTPPTVPTPPVDNVNEKTLQAYTTGYSWYDNTPAGSADISHPVIHQKAGGTGTFSDPITLAVGHSIINGKDILDYPAGTKFYFPFLKKYVIVEDTCGDGNNPQNGPCHTGYKGNVWLDVYVGKGASKSASDNCMNKITDVHTVIQNPVSTYPVVTGDIAANCTVY